MKLILTSDLHIGITSSKQIDRMFGEIAELKPDILVNAGDYCGASMGWKSVRQITQITRAHLPTIPIVSVLGNHDYWCASGTARPRLIAFQSNLARIGQVFDEHKIHWLDRDGIYDVPDTDIQVLGDSGWYANSNPPTNDRNYLPVGIEGDTNSYLASKAYARASTQLASLRPGSTRIWASHFPVYKLGADYKGDFETYSWSAQLGQVLTSEYNVSYILEGHSHYRREGPLVWNCGSDYSMPRYIGVGIE